MANELHPEVRTAADRCGIPIPNLEEAAARAARIIEDAQAKLTGQCPRGNDGAAPYDVVVLGSLARGEVTNGSDVDYLVVAHALPNVDQLDFSHKLLKSMDEFVKNYPQNKLNGPGASGIFGKVVAASDLVERIGLEQDTNLTQTRRILLLEESRSIYRNDLWSRLLDAIIGRYLHDNSTKDGPPRFLINDTIRYWRTLAVDYQAKRWDMLRPDWGLRYLKLIISRKLTFAGTMASLLLTRSPAKQWLVSQFAMPPLARLAQLHSQLEPERLPDLRAILEVADEFVGALNRDEFRDKVKSVESPADRGAVPEFDRFREMAQKTLQPSLERIFFESDSLREKSRKYLSF